MTRRQLKSRRSKLVYQMKRRDRFRAAKLCVNGDGPATHGCRCERCDRTHKESR